MTSATDSPSTGSSPAPTDGATSSAPSTAGTDSAVTGQVTASGTPRDIATGLDTPWSVVFVADTPVVSERNTGRIVEIGTDGAAREIGVVQGIDQGGEGGLLGLAAEGRSLFVYSTGDDGNRIQRYDLTGDPGSFAMGDPTTVIDGLPSASTHNGGRIAIGPDGLLYAGTGDAGERESAQDVAYLGGKILRLNTDGTIPADNPFPGSPVYSLGHRNVQGLAWTADGTMWASEFGQDTWDELNRIEPGANYGWPVVEGIGGDAQYVDPVQQWNPDDASPSGMAAVGDTLFVANLKGERLRLVQAADPGAGTDLFTGEYGRLRGITAAPDGTLWFTTSNTDGRGDPRDGDDRILAVDLVPAG
ncbi:PQQ-dependent sugar dehydrogenase [Nakamurella sp. YIM 132087]|uniref:PQQ-dependent sugar dehydrogenase n=1 Tax=Nakamurella alba TaxID=2665158 RepID=A0A7K1FKH2_9ACTN|nr:PQQ-dependent sugar dehydrogenase [Nakamurella alba]